MEDRSSLRKETQEIWEQNAAFWDEYMGEGGKFQRHLIGPASERLLALQPGERVLEIACGNGAFARRMAALGAWVMATDFSQVFLERARQRTLEYPERIEYRQVDATDEAQLLALGEQAFDAAACNMGLMDMQDIEPLASTLPRLLKPGGRFVFSVQHPCFNSTGSAKAIEEFDQKGELVTVHIMKVWGYLTPLIEKGLGVIGQPAPHYYFHRPLNLLLAPFLRAGFVLDALEEPRYQGVEPTRTFDWANFPEIPPVLLVRLILPQAGG